MDRDGLTMVDRMGVQKAGLGNILVEQVVDNTEWEEDQDPQLSREPVIR